jgi:hypothetical protein
LIAIVIRNEFIIRHLTINAVHPHISGYEPTQVEQGEETHAAVEDLGLLLLASLSFTVKIFNI